MKLLILILRYNYNYLIMLGKDTKILIGLAILLGVLYYMNKSDDGVVGNDGEVTMQTAGAQQMGRNRGGSGMNTDIYPGQILADKSSLNARINYNGGGGSRAPPSRQGGYSDDDVNDSVRNSKTELDEWDDYFRDTNSVIGRSQISNENDNFRPNCEGEGGLAPFDKDPVYKRNKVQRHKEPDGSFDPDMYDPMNLLPQEKHDDWFEVIDEPVALKNRHLISLQQPLGIDTIGQSLKNATHDIRGNPPNPKMVVSPWNQSSIEPDFNLKPLC